MSNFTPNRTWDHRRHRVFRPSMVQASQGIRCLCTRQGLAGRRTRREWALS